MTDTALPPFFRASPALLRAFPPLPSARGWRPELALLVGLLLFALLLPTAPSLLSDADMLWHLRTGQEILATGQFPTVDCYSWTMAGQSWIAKEWLSQVLLALAFAAAGWTGVALLALLAACAAYALVFAAVERRAGPAFAFVCAILLALAGNFHLVARPHVLAWPVVAAFAILLLDAAENSRAPRFRAVLLMVLWANLHGSFLFGLLLIPFFACEAILRAKEQRGALALRWLGFGFACALAVLANPYGGRVIAAARDVLSLGPALSLISEWRPQNFAGFGHFEFILLAGLGAALLSGVKLPAPRVALLLALLHSALAHVRQETLALMIVALCLGAPVAALRDHIETFSREKIPAAFIGLGVLLALMAAALFQQEPLAPTREIAPRAALDAARAAKVRGEALNEDQFGGYLISQHIKTYADGRAEFFGSMHVDLSLALAGRKPEHLAALLANPAINWTILPTFLPANQALAATPGWKLVFQDEVATVFVRN